MPPLWTLRILQERHPFLFFYVLSAFVFALFFFDVFVYSSALFTHLVPFSGYPASASWHKPFIDIVFALLLFSSTKHFDFFKLSDAPMTRLQLVGARSRAVLLIVSLCCTLASIACAVFLSLGFAFTPSNALFFSALICISATLILLGSIQLSLFSFFHGKSSFAHCRQRLVEHLFANPIDRITHLLTGFAFCWIVLTDVLFTLPHLSTWNTLSAPLFISYVLFRAFFFTALVRVTLMHLLPKVFDIVSALLQWTKSALFTLLRLRPHHLFGALYWLFYTAPVKTFILLRQQYLHSKNTHTQPALDTLIDPQTLQQMQSTCEQDHLQQHTPTAPTATLPHKRL